MLKEALVSFFVFIFVVWKKKNLKMTKCVLIELSHVADISEKAMLIVESLNCKTPIPKSAYYGKGENAFEHWIAEWVLPKLKKKYEIKEIKYL